MNPKFRPPNERVTSLADAFAQVRLQWAVAEANRCLLCEDPPCVRGCLAGVDIKRFVRAVRNRNLRAAVAIIRESNFLVAACGRVCPQGELCEGRCTATGLARPIAIGEIQRFVGEAALAQGMRPVFPPVHSEGRVAIVGGGPGGLSAAYYLRMRGIRADLYEKDGFLGGVMMSGIPPFRLPKDLLRAELAPVADECCRVIREEVTDFAGLAARYDALVLACGLGPSRDPDLPGKDLDGVWQADDFLCRIALSEILPLFRETTVVIGGGNTAMDAASVARRLGSDRVIVAYRRTEAEMPAWLADREFAREEGIEFRFLVSPVCILGQEGRVAGIRLQANELGSPDASHRRRPLPIPDAFTDLPCAQVVLALGNAARESWHALGLETVEGRPRVDPVTQETSRSGVFAVGDLTSGGGTVVRAVADGRRAAEAIAGRLNQET